MNPKLKLNVSTFRSAGLEAKWGRTRLGRPAMFVRNPKASLAHQRTVWYLVSSSMFATMERVGVVEGFDRHTLLADMFSISA